MAIYALADLHLPGGQKKTMDRFGAVWQNHPQKIAQRWTETVKPGDTVLLPGDLSWAMTEEEAQEDMAFLSSLPGRKILLRGNHDYWWSSVSRLRRRFTGLEFLQNDALESEGYVICGCRGWLSPASEGCTAQDAKIYARELIRAELSLMAGQKKGGPLLFCCHYPPLWTGEEDSPLFSLVRQAGGKAILFGHVHGQENFCKAQQGEKDGITLYLTSADYLKFTPRRIV
ncbi:MAG TPA: metallophosphoesterase [Firmicutes bacterium]|nr:metallophosphoesterase [Bacillota bacterium]